MGCDDMSDDETETVAELRNSTAVAKGVAALTKREREACSKSLYGATAAEVAGQMGISTRTVERHLQGAMKKTGFNRKSKMLGWMIRKQIILAGDPYGPPGLEVHRKRPNLRIVE